MTVYNSREVRTATEINCTLKRQSTRLIDSINDIFEKLIIPMTENITIQSNKVESENFSK